MGATVRRSMGLVRMVKPQKGFGFILQENGEEIFFHKKDVRCPDGEARMLPAVGERVSFVLMPMVGDKRDRALDVEREG